MNYERLRKLIQNDQNLMQMMRVKPWEGFMLNKFKFSCLTDILEDEAINGYYNFDIDDEKEY